jgi:hypothetical protein
VSNFPLRVALYFAIDDSMHARNQRAAMMMYANAMGW